VKGWHLLLLAKISTKKFACKKKDSVIRKYDEILMKVKNSEIEENTHLLNSSYIILSS